MDLIFVDAENIGNKALAALEVKLADKVFVFGKAPQLRQLCDKALYHHIGDYPSGSNQADFCIIATLARFLSTHEGIHELDVNCLLYSNDEDLISAFNYQCARLGVSSTIVRTKSTLVAPASSKPSSAIIAASLRLYQCIDIPTQFTPALQAKLGLSKGEFTQAINHLIRQQKIRRSSQSQKYWVRCR